VRDQLILASVARRHDGCSIGHRAMVVGYAYTLLLEAVVLAASFGILWLSFWVRDGRRPQLNSLILGRAASGGSLTIDLASSDVQPAGEQNETSCTALRTLSTLITNHKLRPSKTNALTSKQCALIQ
jgi:hypothetical protein